MDKFYHAFLQSMVEKHGLRRNQPNVAATPNTTSDRLQLEASEPHPKRQKVNNANNKYLSADYINAVLTDIHKTPIVEEILDNVNMHEQELVLVAVESAFKNRILTNAIINCNKILDPKLFLQLTLNLISSKVNDMRLIAPIKSQITLICEMILPKTEEIVNIYLNSVYKIIYQTSNIIEWYNEASEKILTRLQEYQERDSGWALRRILQVNLNINKYAPFTVGAKYFVLPKYVQARKAVINVQCSDDCCFAWAIISALRPANRNANRVSSYPDYKDILNLDGVTFPMELVKIPKFEVQNNLSINVYALKTKREWLILNKCTTDTNSTNDSKSENVKYEILPVYVSKSHKDVHINLLMAEIPKNDDKEEEEEECVPNYHFCWIKNLSRLVSNQMTAKHRGSRWLCDRCLCYFYAEKKFTQHKVDCSNSEPVKCVMPNRSNNWIQFQNYKYKEMHPFVIYADLECLLLPIETCEPDSARSFMNAYQNHTPCSISYYLKCNFDDAYSEMDLYRGQDCIEWFVNQLTSLAEKVANIYSNKKEMLPLSTVELAEFDQANICHICEKEFSPPSDLALEGEEEDRLTKVKDHCHLTGKFRGAAHVNCNLNYSIPSDIIVIFHNLQGYDAHFLIRELREKSVINENGEVYLKNPGKISVIAINKEKYKSFTKFISGNKIKLKFIDSFNFMASSLDKLSSYLEDHQITKKYFENVPELKLKLLYRKGVLPYSYLNSFERFSETSLPERKYFFNNLTQSDISESEYIHAQTVFNEFGCRNLGDYADLYLKTDVLLLADVFEEFRFLCKKTYDLDPANYITAPGLSWDSLLKLTKIRLELMTDIDMLLFIERGIRGGISQCCNRYAAANNRYMDNFDSSQPESYLIYLDAVNLYGWAMCQCLPTGNFRWCDEKKFHKFANSILRLPDDFEKGYILEVDLTYPENVHDSHRDFPFCPENKIPPTGKHKKLLTTLEPKHRYIIHYRNLKQCINHGLILTKIYRILEFDQSAWMEPYITKNTKLRMESTNEFQKSYYKLQNNSVFGKSMQNVRKMRDIKLATKWGGSYGAGKQIGKPNFKDRVIFDDDFIAIELNRLKITFNKPLYVGMAILDISKSLMYQFHYDYMKKKYEDANLKLLYMDTDSLIYSVISNNFYSDISTDLMQWFDTSDYSENNPYNFPRVNKKVLGLFKDELNGEIMYEFVGLRAKMYSYLLQSNINVNKAKGIGKSVVKNLSFSEYKNCLFENIRIYKMQNRIISKQHNVYTIKQNKIALCSSDDKRYIVGDSYDTMPWGHYSLY